MWLNISSTNVFDQFQEYSAAFFRNTLLRDMTPEEISKATAMARECMASDYKKCGY